MNRYLIRLQPYLFVLAPISRLFDNNPGEIFLFDLFLICMAFAALIFFLQLLILKIFKDEERTSIVLSILCASLLFSTEFATASKSLIWGLCSLAALAFLFIPLNAKIKGKLASLFTVPLLAIVLFNSISAGILKYQISNEIAAHSLKMPERTASKTFSGNIYVLILDEFISEKSFNDYYKFDNNEFFSYLRKNDFQIINKSTSNYPWTIPSVSSLVNFNYHKTELPKNAFTGVAHHLIANNSLFNILRQEGYQIHHLPCVYWLGNPSTGPFADFMFRTKSYGLVQSIAQLTPWYDHYRTYQRQSHRDQTLTQLRQMELLADGPEKQFVFAHIMCPHRPITFTASGEILSEEEAALAEKDSQHHFYLNQAKFISKQVQETVQTILQKSKTAPIIMLFSDHGKFPIGCSAKGKATLPLKDLAWRFSNLQALHLPQFSKLPDPITPINTVRMVLNHYFGYDLPQLEDYCCPHFMDLQQKTSNLTILNLIDSPN